MAIGRIAGGEGRLGRGGLFLLFEQTINDR